MGMDLAETVLNTVRLGLKLSMSATGYCDSQLEQHVWFMNTRSADGKESWTARGVEKYEAACTLAELVGFDLRE